ncbi:MAG TPA: transcriptional repressor [Phycisphaerae bacterium]|nr:transcriptional repressor [Phycisphaerae bacterium]HOB76301.1 transcriptional repressor [Phycisphaerae bacterium]HOJ53803.1 transcriptional repressor [Phycisphaerae bacterium]HOL28277.1 transcriptional repressor [Phycisphaerae bacterium]HPP21485.1 transcriptional repressor [Phycisphaerae bacterium]
MAKPLRDDEIRTAETIFREYLRDHGLKYTPERATLLQEVLSNPEHFEAEQLLISLRQAGKRVAKATIYRTLPLLVDCGIINQVQFGDTMARYEQNFGRPAHDHMVCRRCRRIVEFDSSEVLRLRDEISRRHHFEPTSHRFQISGVCAQCRGIDVAPPTEERATPPDKRPARGKASNKGRRRSKASGR